MITPSLATVSGLESNSRITRCWERPEKFSRRYAVIKHRTQMRIFMHQIARHWLTSSLVAGATAAVVAACADNAPLGPGSSASGPRVTATAASSSLDALLANTGLDNRVPDLTGCEQVTADPGSQLAFRVYSKGVQIYRWSGTAWVFVAPSAQLFADAGLRGLVGNHFGGPTWQTLSGSTVVGAVRQRCTKDPNSIQWLLLD